MGIFIEIQTQTVLFGEDASRGSTTEIDSFHGFMHMSNEIEAG